VEAANGVSRFGVAIFGMEGEDFYAAGMEFVVE
jgi:hypothetical protein